MGDISSIKHRQAVTKLRISSHRLPVESGRYNNVPFDKRTCKLCNLNEVGNEQHYLIQCSNTLFKEIRYSFIQKLHQINSSFSLFNDQDLFLYIISMKDRSITKLFAKFCYDILAGPKHFVKKIIFRLLSCMSLIKVKRIKGTCYHSMIQQNEIKESENNSNNILSEPSSKI